MTDALCSCDTKKLFSECCEPILKGVKIPEYAVDLMRSRYTAFVRHEIDYLLNTLSAALKKETDRKELEKWSRDTQWEGLEILATEKGGPADKTGRVEFKARFREDGEVKEHHESATFEKLGGAWFFQDGRTPPSKPIKSDATKIGRNDPCHCGSGKKFKKCCGIGSP